LIDVAEMKHVATVKKTDLIGLGVAFFGTLILGIELGILVAVVASMLVVFARMSTPHSAVLGHVEGTTSYRNVDRFPEAKTIEGVRVVRIDAALSFVNAVNIKKLLLAQADDLNHEPRALVLDASGINDLDATGAEMLHDLVLDLKDRGIALHVSDVKGPVRDVLRRSGLWDQLGTSVYSSTSEAVAAIHGERSEAIDQRQLGIDERGSCRGKAQTNA